MVDFLESCMWVAKVPQPLIEKTLLDNKSISKRTNELFPAITNQNFKDAIHHALQNKLESEKLLSTWEKAIVIRNIFIHRGNQWGIPEDFAKDCWDSIVFLFRGFVALHNTHAVEALVPTNMREPLRPATK